MTSPLQQAIDNALSHNSTNASAYYGFNCTDPLTPILATLRCIEMKNATCATSGYNTEHFVKIHNDVNTNTTIYASGTFWTQAFALLSFQLNVSDARVLEPNLAHLRYVETVTFTDGSNLGLPSASTTYPFGQTHVQHEDALVWTDDDCRIVIWDQYGDNAEQDAVTTNVNDLLCARGAAPPTVPCASPTNNNVTSSTPTPSRPNVRPTEPPKPTPTPTKPPSPSAAASTLAVRARSLLWLVAMVAAPFLFV